jgi:hypothetical protein
LGLTLLLGALFNHKQIETLLLCTKSRIDSDLLTTLTSIATLKKVDVSRNCFIDFSQELIAQSFGSIRSLEHLVLRYGANHTDSSHVALSILRAVAALPKLGTVVFEFGEASVRGEYDGLNTFVSMAPALTGLEFRNGRFTGDVMAQFAAANHASLSLKSLTLDSCSFDNEAVTDLASCVTFGLPMSLEKLRFAGKYFTLGNFRFGQLVA